METAKVWIGESGGRRMPASTFEAENPATGEKLGRAVSGEPVERLRPSADAAVEAAHALEQDRAGEDCRVSGGVCERTGGSAEAMAQAAHEETALPVSPRLKDVEIAANDRSAAAGRGGVRGREAGGGRSSTEPKNLRSCLGTDRAGGGVWAE